MKKTISIIIPVFNGLAYTKKCLADLNKGISINPDQNIAYEIIIVDDGSTDNTGQWIKDNYPDIHIINGDGNLWWSGGINKGTEYALHTLKSDYILWWNNDIYQADDYFVRLSGLVATNCKDTVWGSKIYYAESPETIWSFGGEFFPKKGNRHMVGTYHPDGPEFSQPRQVDWFAGMGTVFPVEIIKSIGLLNQEEFPQYHGDSDYTYRAKLAGNKLEIRPELKIWNYTDNTGNYHDNSVKKLFSTLTDIKSTYNLGKDILFYRKYAESPLAYSILIKKYFEYIAGFFKWKFLNMLGVKQKVIDGKIREVKHQ